MARWTTWIPVLAVVTALVALPAASAGGGVGAQDPAEALAPQEAPRPDAWTRDSCVYISQEGYIAVRKDCLENA